MDSSTVVSCLFLVSRSELPIICFSILSASLLPSEIILSYSCSSLVRELSSVCLELELEFLRSNRISFSVFARILSIACSNDELDANMGWSFNNRF